MYDTKVISITNEDITLAGKIDSANCNWKTPFKEGKTILMVTITRANGEELTSKLTIEGKEGKLILLVEFDDPTANKLRFVLDRFEETK